MAFFLAGTLGLYFIAPELSRGLFFVPTVAAVVHLFVLGWVVLSIFGALCQFMPVAVGRGLRWERLAHVSFASHVLGVALFVLGLVSTRAPVLHAGATFLTVSFTLFAINLGATLIAVKDRSLTWWALSGATVFILATPVYGVLLALNLHSGLFQDRFLIVATHAHVAIIGFIMLVVVGVAHRLLPMFLLSHGASERPAWIAVTLFFSAAAILAIPYGPSVKLVIAGVLASGGVFAFVTQAIGFFRNRKRKAVDPGMRLAGVGIVGLVVATLIAPFALTRGVANMQLLVTYFAVIIGALSMFVAGHYYKIVPFLVWYHRFGPLVGLRKVPKVADLYSAKVASVNAALLVTGWLGTVASIVAGSELTLRLAALVFTVGVAVEIVAITRIAQRRPA